MDILRISLPVVLLAVSVFAQSAGSQPQAGSTQSGAGQLHRQSNASSATQDNSGISGDQVTKPAGAKVNTLIGCLGGPDSDGHFTLNSMQYRSGIEVLGPTNLGSAAGQKVKLTGDWAPSTAVIDSAEKQARRFQATSFDVLADKCPPPAETTPVSKKKQKQRKAAAEAGQVNPQ